VNYRIAGTDVKHEGNKIQAPEADNSGGCEFRS
jgi:hypothetical protein